MMRNYCRWSLLSFDEESLILLWRAVSDSHCYALLRLTKRKTLCKLRISNVLLVFSPCTLQSLLPLLRCRRLSLLPLFHGVSQEDTVELHHLRLWLFRLQCLPPKNWYLRHCRIRHCRIRSELITSRRLTRNLPPLIWRYCENRRSRGSLWKRSIITYS